jgi:hypothetical protein
MLAGAVLGPAGFGLTAGQAALTAGAIRGATSGSLEKGIAFGLGAYGGAGLSGALLNTGTQMAANTAVAGDLGAAAGDSALTATQAAQAAKASPLSTMGQGAKGLFEKEGRDIFMKEAGGLSGLSQYGMAAAAPALMAPQTTTPMPTSNGVRRQYYSFDPGRRQDPEAGYTGPRSGERTYFNPTFRRLPEPGMAEGGSTSRFSGNAYLNNLARQSVPSPTAGLTPLEKPFESEEEHEYIYDPITQRFRRAKKPKKQDDNKLGSSVSDQFPPLDTGGGIGTGMDSGSTLGDFGHSMGDAGVGAISLGQGLSALGVGLGFNAGATGSGRGGWGDAISNYGIDQLGRAEAQAAADSTAYGRGPTGDAAAAAAAAAGYAAADAQAGDAAFGGASFGNTAASNNTAGLSAAAGDSNASTSGTRGLGSSTGNTAGLGNAAASSNNAGLAAALAAAEISAAMDAASAQAAADQAAAAAAAESMGSALAADQAAAAADAAADAASADAAAGAAGAAAGADAGSGLGYGGDGYGGTGDGSGGFYAEGGTINRNMGGISSYAGGGYNLGDYSDGGRLLRGPGDGVSDSIPAVIGQRRPARLADGEFVIPARIVSELGNGSTEAGARKLYAMMDRVQRARGKTTGKGRVAKNTRADKYLPA